ncbi:hypothetical protein [Mycobacteroides abscessus]|uniref:hypothetical protein n=1 Tax=Mycobacteroides abscessus TaxID=36809 RepID=UPI0009263359|nr:hypothetical protein [Mycobacteroides abscessus]SHO84043.1 Uncharacterised protein [Mycobacteroides abscessus subsp. abscessus]SHP00308.1 Uncharacterised protein [Mycobacteroides abscessus subsp. abscessus]SHP51723.1 Uncharacterised protein [Mycobacteroides abscessus subsp. abscessus]SHP67456.1 Uncharacterised protein [Mycobacteroides abscessus subsp. abscessus]SHP73561.1 Uncharacterised protein [Mycobacteroides abscessus subsp. abscessus]
MDIKVTGDVYAWIVKPARPRSMYSGRGEGRVVTGREYDDDGAPLSAAEVLLISDSLGVTPGATLVMPDSVAAAVPVGAIVAVTGRNELSARILGGDFGSTRVSILGITDARIIADGAQLIREAAIRNNTAGRSASGTAAPTPGKVSA